MSKDAEIIQILASYAPNYEEHIAISEVHISNLKTIICHRLRYGRSVQTGETTVTLFVYTEPYSGNTYLAVLEIRKYLASKDINIIVNQGGAHNPTNSFHIGRPSAGIILAPRVDRTDAEILKRYQGDVIMTDGPADENNAHESEASTILRPRESQMS
ncbi:hypothetical protein FQN55_001108 [Onygenales sp. PD_40]|nr:hypothetical protein FQN55_001108 [Onygenales sp. PD_40]